MVLGNTMLNSGDVVRLDVPYSGTQTTENEKQSLSNQLAQAELKYQEINKQQKRNKQPKRNKTLINNKMDNKQLTNKKNILLLGGAGGGKSLFFNQIFAGDPKKNTE